MIGYLLVSSLTEVFSPSPRSRDHPLWHQTSVIKLQVCLLGMARLLKKDLEQLAEIADTSSSGGLNYILKEATLSLLRHPDFCISGYSSVHLKQSLEDGEKLFDRFSIEERGKFDEETLSNVNNIKRKTGTRSQSEIGSRNEYIVMTILVAAAGSQDLPIISSSADLKEALQKLGSISSNGTLAVEVLWTPQEENDTLSEQELLEKYPHLRSLHWTSIRDTDTEQLAITHKIRDYKKKTTKL
ncbi:myelin-associated oligodendrocyte basic protein [Thalictrum thalictroides]|uniref:Myelin-associated oligodendrocyte basic protein n=1 Tax=Thalictrum thalictroides TaxID=46969 RepID=A0A7J6VR84_THATH|nr:myelin-associated oligodendrocyte basic protein [Thalictrum thalictroides]